MRRYIKNVHDDLAAKNYFNAGKDTADAFVVAVGPVKG
jgi:hypothetical protein